MKHIALAVTAALALMASPLHAALFTHWTVVNPSANARGTFGSVTVDLTGGELIDSPTGAFFASGNFTPPTASSEALTYFIGAAPDIMVTFSGVVTDPVIHIAGAFGQGLDGTLTFNAPVTKLSGTAGFAVAGDLLSVSGGPGDEGTVQLSGTFTTFTIGGVANLGVNPIVIQIGGTPPAGGCSAVCSPNGVVPTVAGQCTATLSPPTASAGCEIASSTASPAGPYNLGMHTVTWTVTFTDGSTATCVQTFTVADLEIPTIACPANILINTDPGNCSAVVANLGSATADDNCFAPVTAVRSDLQPLASPFPKGVTVITYTASDAAHNSASCQQIVTVEDHEKPEFSCPPDGPVATVPPPVTTGATDNCFLPITITSEDIVTGSCSIVVTRKYTVTDSSGNVTTCQQIITVSGGLFAADTIVWHQPLARSGSDDTDPSAGGTVKYRFKMGSTIPIKVHALGCSGDVTGNANVIGTVEVFGDSNCDTVADGNELPIDYNGVGGAGGVMDNTGSHLKYNLDTKSLPSTTKCYVLKVTVTDTSTGQEKSETVLLQAK